MTVCDCTVLDNGILLLYEMELCVYLTKSDNLTPIGWDRIGGVT